MSKYVKYGYVSKDTLPFIGQRKLICGALGEVSLET